MKKFCLLLVFFPFLAYTQAEEERIQEIRAWYKDVESRLDKCVKIPITMFYDEDYVTGGSTEMEGFYDTTQHELIKIVEHTYYDWAEDESAFYFHKGELFFIFSKGNNPGEMYTAEELGVSEQELWEMGGEAKSLSYYEERIYFQNDSCIRYLHKEKEFPVNEDADLKDVKNEKLALNDSTLPLVNRHGYKMFAQFARQLPKK